MLESTTCIQINLFYPFLVLIMFVILVIFIVFILKQLFFKSNDNAKEITIDTTTKMKDMYSDSLKINFTVAHEKEIHELEKKVEELQKIINFKK